MQALSGHRRAVRALAYAPAGGPAPLLASAGDDQTIRLWGPTGDAPWGELGVLESRRDGLLSLGFSPDGTRLATGGRAGSLAVWDVQKREAAAGAAPARCSGPVIALSFTSDGRALLAGLRSQHYDGGEPGRLLCWNLNPPHPVEPMGYDGDVESVAIAPSRDLLAVAGQHRGLELWEVGRCRPAEPALWLPARVRGLCFSPGPAARHLAIATGRVIQLWDVEESRPGPRCVGHRADVYALAFSADGQHLLSGGGDRSARLWEVPTGRMLAAWDWQVGAVHAVALSPDGMTAAAGGEKSSLVIWDL